MKHDCTVYEDCNTKAGILVLLVCITTGTEIVSLPKQ